MKKLLFIICLVIISSIVKGQNSWVYNFNDAAATASFTTTSGASTTFLPTPTTGGGTSKVKIGSTGGSFNLNNPGTSLGNSYELNGVSPTSTSNNKFSIYGYNPSKMFNTSFKMRFDGGTSGTWFFFQGTGASYSDNGGFATTQTFSGLRFVFGASNTIVTSRRDASGWTTAVTGITAQATDYLVEIYGNNSTATINYAKSGAQSVASNTWDLWINGVLVGNNIPKSLLAGDTDINSFMFYGESSAGNVANIYLDDITYSNDFIAPTFTALYPKADNINGTSFDLISNINEIGTTYYVVLPDGATVPTSAQVAAGNNANNVAAGFSGSVANAIANTDYFKSITGLTLNTAYDVYVVAKDAANNFQANPIKLDVTTLTTLPITLTSFTGIESNQSIVLNWITATEKNNKNFEILRSVDGKAFKTIGTVDGAGDSDVELKYSFIDANPFGGINYYQLKQIDFDGKNATSPTIAVDSKIAETQITVYATSSSVNIGITSPNQSNGKLSLFDISGRKITEQNITLNKGYNILELNETLKSGVHFVTLENEGKLHRQKFIK